jgi:hypothetical protein
MALTVNTFFDGLKEAAEAIEDKELQELIDITRSEISKPKPNILVIGSVGAGRFSTVNVILGAGNKDKKILMLPVSAIPKLPLSVMVSYDKTEAIEVSFKNGLKSIISKDELKKLLIDTGSKLGGETNKNQNSKLDIEDTINGIDNTLNGIENILVRTNSTILKNYTLRVEAIEREYSQDKWREILATADYILFVLNSTAIFSEREKWFIKNIMSEGTDFNNVAIVINKMDMIDEDLTSSFEEDEVDSIEEAVEGFFDSFNNKPLMIYGSAQKSPAELYDSIKKQFILKQGNEVKENNSNNIIINNIKYNSFNRTADLCINRLINSALNRKMIIDKDENEILKMISRLDSRNEYIDNSKNRMFQKIEAFVNVVIKEEFLREIESFTSVFKSELSNEIKSVDRVDNVRRYLSGYIEEVWAEFFETKTITIKNRIAEQIEEIVINIKKDLRELFSGENDELDLNFEKFDSMIDNSYGFILPRRNGNAIDNICTGFSVAGACMIFFSLPIGLAGLGAGYAIRALNQKAIDDSDKESIASSAVDTLSEVEINIKHKVEEWFKNITEEINNSIEEIYKSYIDAIKKSLEEGLEKRDVMNIKKDSIENLINNSIPELMAFAHEFEKENDSQKVLEAGE